MGIVKELIHHTHTCIATMGHSSFSHGADGYSGTLPGEQDEVIMTGLEIAMSREVFGWPIYTIVIAAGQVCFFDSCLF